MDDPGDRTLRGRRAGLSAFAGHVLFGLATAAAVVASGALAGALLFPAAGWLVDTGYSPAELARNGARHGGFLGIVWGPGIGIVAAIIRAHRRRRGR